MSYIAFLVARLNTKQPLTDSGNITMITKLSLEGNTEGNKQLELPLQLGKYCLENHEWDLCSLHFHILLGNSKREKQNLFTTQTIKLMKCESLGKLEKAVEALACSTLPTAFTVLPNFQSCLYNSIETWHRFSIS